jgi:hypothetical protein
MQLKITSQQGSVGVVVGKTALYEAQPSSEDSAILVYSIVIRSSGFHVF